MIRKSFKFEVLGHEIELHAYIEENAKGKDSVLIFPGGGYAHLSTEREGVAIAKAYYERGLNAFVLHYAVGSEYKYPSHLTDASFAITYLKAHSEEFGIDPDHIAVMGSSAGGHLTAAVSTYRMKLEGEGVMDSNMNILETPSYENLYRFVIDYADGVIATSANADASLLEYARSQGKKVLEYSDADAKEVFDNYKRFYDEL